MGKRRIIRYVLCLCGAAAISVFSAALFYQGVDAPETWLVAAAALAVLTSLSSAWSTQITAEMQEDQLRPYVIIYLETNTRYQLMHVKMQNIGRGTAFEISDRWNQPLLDYKGNSKTFGTNGSPVSVLHPGEYLSKSINTPAQFYQTYREEIYNGEVQFRDAAGRTYRGDFLIDPGQFKDTLLYAEEKLRTHYELQQIPNKLGELINQVRQIVALLRQRDDTSRRDST